MPAPEKLKTWCRRLANDLTPDGKISRVELLFDGGEPSQTIRIAVYPIGEETDPDELAEDAWSQADDDAATRPMNSHLRYGLFGFRAEATEHSCMFSWLVRGRGPSAVAGPFGNDTMDPPNERGLAQVALRGMNEAIRQTLQATESQTGGLAAELSQERSLRRAAESAQLDLMVIQQTLLDTSTDRALKIEREARRAARIDKLLDGIAPMVPLLLGELVASRGLPKTGKTGRDAAVGMFLESLDEEQFAKIFATLDQQQGLSIIEIIKAYRRDAEARDAAVATAKSEMSDATNVTPIRSAKDAG